MQSQQSTTPAKEASTFSAGVGLKPAHYQEALESNHVLDFFEVHAENFFGAGGPPHRWLSAISEKFDLSIHGVCLSIGAPAPLHKEHLVRLADLVCRYQPKLVSEHLAWCGNEGLFHNDLLPAPLNSHSFQFVRDHVNEVQDVLGRQILIENPSLYLDIKDSDIAEPDFLNALAAETGCGLLFDVNNVFVSASNLGFSAADYCRKINPKYVKEIHLAGHVIDVHEGQEILVDNHGAPICDEVLELYSDFVASAGHRPTLVEWDTDVPEFSVLVAETRRAFEAAKVPMKGDFAYA